MSATAIFRDPKSQLALVPLTVVAGLAWALLIACVTQESFLTCGGERVQFGNGLSSEELTLRLALMWMVMAPAMMLPTGAGDILRTLSDRRLGAAPASAALSFSAGYLAAVTIGGLAGAIMTDALLWTGAMSQETMKIGPVAGGAVLIGLGVYYFSPFKHQSMQSCSESVGNSEDCSDPMCIGWSLGLSCLDGCAVMICIQCVFGVMNLYLMAGLVAWMIIEKVLPRKELVARVTGIGLILLGLGLATG
jgi:predicted metal-binding membrane protein